MIGWDCDDFVRYILRWLGLGCRRCVAVIEVDKDEDAEKLDHQIIELELDAHAWEQQYADALRMQEGKSRRVCRCGGCMHAARHGLPFPASCEERQHAARRRHAFSGDI